MDFAARSGGGSVVKSTFYAFPNISSTGLSSWDLAKYLAKEHKVAVVPGSISFAASMKQLEEGIERIGRGMAALG
jgi:aspartate/methionine/tyrosine aminotransferase